MISVNGGDVKVNGTDVDIMSELGVLVVAMRKHYSEELIRDAISLAFSVGGECEKSENSENC